MYRDSNGWIDQYRQKDALWIHDGNPLRPHALLTSGKHSSGFFNSRLVIPDEKLLREAASDLIDLFTVRGGYVSRGHGVAGPQTGATKLAEFVSAEITDRTGRSCFWVSPAKGERAGRKVMIFTDADAELLSGHPILSCEDVLTTGVSVGLASAAVTEAGGTVLPFILVLVNRSGLTQVGGKKIVALIDRAMPTWEPGECPLCTQGSEAIRPKGPPEWARLNASY